MEKDKKLELEKKENVKDVKQVLIDANDTIESIRKTIENANAVTKHCDKAINSAQETLWRIEECDNMFKNYMKKLAANFANKPD